MKNIVFTGYDEYTQSRGSTFDPSIQPFNEALKEFKKVLEKKEDFCLVIGVTRLNFYKLDIILNFLFGELGSKNKVKYEPFEITPLLNIRQRFDSYLANLTSILSTNLPLVTFSILDKNFFEIVSHIENITSEIGESELLLGIGPIFEGVFRGPKRMLIDLTTFCNTNCVYCRAHSPLYERTLKPRFLSWPILKKFINECALLGVENVSLVGSGEPTTHPHFHKILDELGRQRIKVDLSTNLLKMSDNVFSSMLKHLWSLTVSISAGSEETYDKLHPGQGRRYRTVINNLTKIGFSKKNKEDTPGLIILHCINRENFHEMEKMIDDAYDVKANSVWFQLLHATPGMEHLILEESQTRLLPETIERVRKKAENLGISFSNYISYQVENFESDKGGWSSEIMEKGGCFVGWFFTYLCAHSYINFCCGLKTIERVTEKKGLKAIWESDKYNHTRTMAKFPRNRLNIECIENVELTTKRYLWDDFCLSCDNHNFNQYIIDLLKKSRLDKYLLPFIPQEPIKIIDIIVERRNPEKENGSLSLNLGDPLKIWVRYHAYEEMENVVVTFFMALPTMIYNEAESQVIPLIKKNEIGTILITVASMNVIGNFTPTITLGKIIQGNKVIFHRKSGPEVFVADVEYRQHQRFPYADLGQTDWILTDAGPDFKPEYMFKNRIFKSKIKFTSEKGEHATVFFAGQRLMLDFYLKLPEKNLNYKIYIKIYHIPSGYVQIHNLKYENLIEPDEAKLLKNFKILIPKFNLLEGNYNFSLFLFRAENENLLDNFSDAGEIILINKFEDRLTKGIIFHKINFTQIKERSGL